ncbi:MAG: HAMP domain-containing sensor histidine kinase [Lachnospiraceae bacterium]|nr:HAMP domain-containing sensor histidine kinase [Lachnospiraceae bacterium]
MKKNIKWFLVQRFLILLFCIYWSVEVINFLYRVAITPAVLAFLESQQIEITGNSNMVVWLLQMLFYFLTGFLPSGVREWVQGRIEQAMGSTMRIQVTSPLYGGMWGIILRIMMIGGILALLLIRMLPYLVGAFCYSRIVTRQFNELLAQEEAQKLARDQRRNLMLSDIAHDIKTPITTICGYSKALSEGIVAKENRQSYLDAIYAKAMRMDELITLLFEYVKLESEGFTMRKEPGDLAELTREMAALLYADFEGREMELVLEIPEERMPFEMDRLQLGRAITNLLTNAIRYGKENGRVLVRLQDYELTVADDGEPIDPVFAAHIFEPFTRGDRARSSKGGSGLGLGISKKIVEMHGGRLILNRSFGEGYTKAFQIRLPDI